MSPTHRPDFAAFRRNDKDNRSAYMWPYINQEDLTKPGPLPLLLNSRGRHHPSAFAASDGEAMHLGKVFMAIVPAFLNGYTMLLNGQLRQEDYGKVLNWDDHEDAFDWMHTRKQFFPGEGLLVLEYQDRLLGFLVACSTKILVDIPIKDMGNSDLYPVQPEPTRSLSGEATSTDPTNSLAAMAEEGPYRPPPKLDLARIESLLAARMNAAQDHIWTLREDPGYFAEHILQMRDHRQEIIKVGQEHPILKPERVNLLWARIIGSVVVEAYIPLDMFAELRSQAKQLRILQAKYEKQIRPLDDLPAEYLGALLKFRHYLNQTTKGSINQLKMSVVASPGFRPFFARQVPTSPSSSIIAVTSKAGVRMDEIASQLLWLLRTIWEDDDALLLCRLPTVVDELDRYLQSEPKATGLVSPYIASVIGDLSIAAECMKQIDNYQPWANKFETDLLDRKEGIMQEFETHHIKAKLLESLKDANLIPISPSGDPSQKRFDYPAGKKRSQANTDRLRESEANLDHFWVAIDRLVFRKVGDLKGTHLGALLSEPRALQRTPEWVEPTKVDGKAKAEQPQNMITKPLSSIFHFDTSSSAPTSGRKEALAAAAEAASKTKIKTRGVPSDQDAPTASSSSAQPVNSESQLIPVDARTLKVFRMLFFTPSPDLSPGEVAWSDFLHAMASTGFTAQKLYGSVWHFQPSAIDLERSIQFHEPHPRGKIPFRVARRHGRRLSRAYGWFGGMFALKREEASDAVKA